MELAKTNAFVLLPDDNDGQIEEFLNKVSEEAKVVAADEMRKKKLEEEDKARKMEEEKRGENYLRPSMTRAKIPVISKRLHDSHIVFRKQKPQDEEGKDQEIGKNNPAPKVNGDNPRVYTHSSGYRRNYERSNLSHENNNGGQHNKNNNDGGWSIPRRDGGGGGGCGRGRSEWRQNNGEMGSADHNTNGNGQNPTRVEVSDNLEKQEIAGEKEEQPINGDNGAESKEQEKKNKKNSKKQPTEEEIDPEKTMTYQQYEELLLEKKKALQALVGSDKKSRPSVDKDEFECMKPIGKKTEKPNSVEDNATKKEKVANKEKGSNKSMAIEFCASHGGRGSRWGRYDGRNGRFDSNYGAELEGRGGGVSDKAPMVDDINQFPALS